MKWIRYFILSSGTILLAAALTRFLIAAGDAQVLSLPDPLLGIPLRYAVLLVGGLELAVALICLFGKKPSLQAAWVAWLMLDYILFRGGLMWMNSHSQATCIGALTDPLHLSRGIIGTIISLIPFYLFVGSFVALGGLWLENRKSKVAKSLKMSCPACGTHIRFSGSNLGRRIPCPHCKTAVILRRPEENLKMSCFFCKEHIEFPAHALGEKLQCPHCKMDITLKEPA